VTVAARRPLELTHDGVPETIAMRHVHPSGDDADLQGCSLSEIAGCKIVPHNDEALMDFGLVILPPVRVTASRGIYFGQRPIYPAIWNQARRKDRRKLTGLLKFASDVRRPGGNVVD
jgi:hypothetical protein